MKKWTQDELLAAGYKIENAKIERVDLSMANHGCMTLVMVLDGAGWAAVYGGYNLGYGYLGATEFKATSSGLESIMMIMNTVGCEDFNDMNERYIRVATKGWGSPIKIIGNVLKDEWFDCDSFFKDKK